MNEMQIFNNKEFGEVRTINKDGEVWFVANDVAIALGYSKVNEAVNTNVEKEDTALMGVLDSNNHTQQTKVINESGMYALVFGSRLPSAKRFKHWVTAEVLPSIRKTGGYQLPTSTRGQIKLLMQANEETNVRVDKLENEIVRMKEDAPISLGEADVISSAVRKKGVEICGGKKSAAYHDRSISQPIFMDIYAEIHRNFGIRSYKLLSHKDISRCMEVIDGYKPPIVYADKIKDKNAAYEESA